jgi:hypothetical protein
MLRRDDVDLRAVLGRAIELVDDLLVVQVVDLEGGCAPACPPRQPGGRTDLLDQPLAERERRDEQLAERLRVCEARPGS